MKRYARKMPEQAKAKRDGEVNQMNYNFNKLLLVKFCCSQNATNQPKSIVEHCFSLVQCIQLISPSNRSGKCVT